MVLPLVVLGLAASGATMTLVLDLFLKRPFLSAGIAGLLPPTALALALEPGHLGTGMRVFAFGVAAAFTTGPALAVAAWRHRRSRRPQPPPGV